MPANTMDCDREVANAPDGRSQTRQLTLSLPDTVYTALVEAATRQRVTAENHAARLLGELTGAAEVIPSSISSPQRRIHLPIAPRAAPKIVALKAIKMPIKASPGFDKKGLSAYKLDLLALCQYGCRYCSSNNGNYLRINREKFADETEAQLGQRLLPADDPKLMFVWPDILDELKAQLARMRRGFGAGKVLVFSMLTDGFSPQLVADGTTKAALDLILEHTQFLIRVLTKNAAVGSPFWINYFKKHPGRFIVGLSTGTLDDPWAKQVEVGTSPPTTRLKALRALQDAGVPTYGMLCPVFPDVLDADALEGLIDEIRPDRVETVWAEPFNDRGGNWRVVRDGYEPNSPGYKRISETFDSDASWSAYATELYRRIRAKADREGWTKKLNFMLYEEKIQASDAGVWRGLRGVSLQGPVDEQSGKTKNVHLRQWDKR